MYHTLANKLHVGVRVSSNVQSPFVSSLNTHTIEVHFLPRMQISYPKEIMETKTDTVNYASAQ